MAVSSSTLLCNAFNIPKHLQFCNRWHCMTLYLLAHM
jgi:hypothetical protein